jgi:hypothetical protein
MNLRESPVAIFTIITALAITIAIWFFATHRCARSHMGTCYTTRRFKIAWNFSHAFASSPIAADSPTCSTSASKDLVRGPNAVPPAAGLTAVGDLCRKEAKDLIVGLRPVQDAQAVRLPV